MSQTTYSKIQFALPIALAFFALAACGEDDPKPTIEPENPPATGQVQLVQIVERVVAAAEKQVKQPDQGEPLQTEVETAAQYVVATAEESGVDKDTLTKLRAATDALVKWTKDMEVYRQLQNPTGSPPPMPSLLTPQLIEALFPPLPPEGSGPSEGEGSRDQAARQQQQMMNSLLGLGGAVLCMVKPPLCIVLMPMMASLGLGGETRSAVETMQDVQTAVQTGRWDPELVKKLATHLDDLTAGKLDNRLTRVLGELPERLQNANSMEEALLRLAEDTIAETQLVESLIDQLPDWGQKVMKAIRDGKEADFVVSLLPSDDLGPYFTNETQKRLVRAGVRFIGKELAKQGITGVTEKYWDGGLAKVGLQSDPNRKRTD